MSILRSKATSVATLIDTHQGKITRKHTDGLVVALAQRVESLDNVVGAYEGERFGVLIMGTSFAIVLLAEVTSLILYYMMPYLPRITPSFSLKNQCQTWNRR